MAHLLGNSHILLHDEEGVIYLVSCVYILYIDILHKNSPLI